MCQRVEGEGRVFGDNDGAMRGEYGKYGKYGIFVVGGLRLVFLVVGR